MKRYRTIVADPPWAYDDGFGGFNGATSEGVRQEVRRALPYGSMTVEEISAVPVASLADDEGANVFCWTTNRYLPATFSVLVAWGVGYRQTLVWHKTGANPLTGSVAPTSCEFLVFGRIGKGAPLSGKWESALVTTKRLASRHSAKPEGFLDRIEAVSPGPYVEMFARRARFGWDYWGDQSLGTAEMLGEAAC